MDGSLKVLLVEYDREQAALVKDDLQKCDPRFEVETISSEKSYLKQLIIDDNAYKAVIVNCQPSDSGGYEFLREIEKKNINTPVVVVSNQETDPTAFQALTEGTYDYLVQDPDYLAKIVQQTIEEHDPNTRLPANHAKRLQSIIDGSTELIYQVNRDLEVMVANKTLAELCGSGAEELIGKKCYDLYFECERPCAECPAKLTFETHQPQCVEKRHGNEFYEVRSHPVSGEERTLESVTVYCRQITEKKTIEKSLIQSEKLATLGLLSSGIAHEIRNPLNVIETARYYLDEFLPDKSPEIQDKLVIIQKNVRRASKIIQSLLEFARDSRYEKEMINLTRLIQSTVSLLGKELTAKNIEFDLNTNKGFFTFFSIDALKQVLLNIIINGIQAMPNGGKLSVAFENGTNSIDIKIADTGIGIPEENLAHIFEPFFTTKENDVGTGLGLYLSKMIIERAGGRLTVKSKPGQGTTFTVSLPSPDDEQEWVAK